MGGCLDHPGGCADEMCNACCAPQHRGWCSPECWRWCLGAPFCVPCLCPGACNSCWGGGPYGGVGGPYYGAGPGPIPPY